VNELLDRIFILQDFNPHCILFEPPLKHPVVFGSSRAAHYSWHMDDYLNRGEPWYGGFRESQSDYRIDNQKFYENNYLPNMLGWFLIYYCPVKVFHL